jgi:hypothetical protein
MRFLPAAPLRAALQSPRDSLLQEVADEVAV